MGGHCQDPLNASTYQDPCCGSNPYGFTPNDNILSEAANFSCSVNSSIEIGEPGYEEPCGASCSANFWPTDYQRTVAVRKLLYDTEGGHYTSPIKACATLYSLSGSDYRVKTPHQYNSSCVGPEFCNMSSAFSLFHTPVNQLSQYCAEKAILTASDAMWQASWLAGCSY